MVGMVHPRVYPWWVWCTLGSIPGYVLPTTLGGIPGYVLPTYLPPWVYHGAHCTHGPAHPAAHDARVCSNEALGSDRE